MIRKLKIRERVFLPLAAIVGLPLLFIALYPLLVVGAIYVGIVGEYERTEPGVEK